MTTRDDSPEGTHTRRSVRSFVLRAGRMTAGQKRAMDELWPLYGIEAGTGEISFSGLYPREAPVTMEIGFGNGENLVHMARNAPDQNFLGIEVHPPGVGHCLLAVAEQQIDNLRVISDDAVDVLQTCIPDFSVNRVNLFFPDPWPKKRHHKRRIVTPEFVELVSQKLHASGMLHIATDWPSYAEHIEEVMAKSSRFIQLADFPHDRITTRFDKRGERLGHINWERAWTNSRN
jgi:tRNA (guanine-N7-)-methyltransferase